MSKTEIIETIQALASANGGVPVGRTRLLKEAGITEGQYSKYGTLGELQIEAGFIPNTLNKALNETDVIRKLITLCAELNDFPTIQKMRQARANKPDRFPSPNVFSRLGRTKLEKAATIISYLSERDELAEDEKIAFDVCQPLALKYEEKVEIPKAKFEACGYVYLLSDSKAYKIGSSRDPDFRRLALQTGNPREIKLIHSIITDDPTGIEDYWHRRFSECRRTHAKGTEWFNLSQLDVAAFRSRVRM